jgi:ELWxxDGT repeat protein
MCGVVIRTGGPSSQLWKCDGTVAGTVIVTDINQSGDDFLGGPLLNFNGTLFLTGSDGIHQFQLWTSDGTSAGTVPITSDPGGLSIPSKSVAIGNNVYFIGSDSNGTQLWKSDGTPSGTMMITDVTGALHAGLGETSPLTNVNGVLYFAINDGNGPELWRSDGTASGTVMVVQLPGNQDNPSPQPPNELINATVNYILFGMKACMGPNSGNRTGRLPGQFESRT